MLAQGVLGFQYEAESSSARLTSLAGLPLYLDLTQASGLAAAISQHLRVAGTQGWLDVQMVVALILLNLAGGDCMEDLERLEQDKGFAAVLRTIERKLGSLICNVMCDIFSVPYRKNSNPILYFFVGQIDCWLLDTDQ